MPKEPDGYICYHIASVPWSVIESFDDINDAVVAWNNLFIDVANQHAPLKRIRTSHASKSWITNDLKELMTKRDYALRVAKRSGNQEQWNEYRRWKNFVNRKIKSAEGYLDNSPRTISPRIY